MQAGDIITQVNTEMIQDSSQLVSMVNKAKIGDALSLTVYRKGELLTVSLRIGEKILENERKSAQ